MLIRRYSFACFDTFFPNIQSVAILFQVDVEEELELKETENGKEK